MATTSKIKNLNFPRGYSVLEFILHNNQVFQKEMQIINKYERYDSILLKLIMDENDIPKIRIRV